MEEAVGEWPFIVFAVELTLRPKEFLDNDNDAICYFIVEPLGKYETMEETIQKEKGVLADIRTALGEMKRGHDKTH
uniref:Uncharacterized protein n=1 Tax=Vespula pensylvanica TaxID=30213 RepID=A0A834KVH6_VESPE|nr:hypothetical protein H0235_013533 [Vespula pensylvanica]